jgi:lysophospholipase L1-like esterase
VIGPAVKRVVRLVSVNLGLLLAGLVALELVFGGWLSRDPLERLNLGRDSVIRVDASGLYPGGAPFTYRRDHWGFRGAGVDPARIEILTIGGSTTNQLYLPDPLTWQTVMGDAMAAAGRPSVIANAGIDGQSTIGHLFNFDAWFPFVPGLHPRMVLAYVGINDAMIGKLTPDSLAFSSFHKWFRHNSALFRLGRTVSGALEARRANLTHAAIDFDHAQWTDQPNTPDNSTAHPASDLGQYSERLRRLVERIRAIGAVPVLVTQTRGDYRIEPDGRVIGLVGEDRLNGIDHWRLLGAFNAATLAVCAETGAVCLDLADAVRFAPGDFYDHVHNTPAGAERIGLWLAGRIRPLLP